MIIGNDEKVGFGENMAPITREPGHDTVSILDISQPATPRIVATMPLPNTIVGPPTNLAITPHQDLALVANSLTPGEGGKLVPDDKVYVIDLKANPPAVIGTVTAGKQASGMAISPDGTLALVANRADGSISVLSISGKDVKLSDTLSLGTAADNVSAVAFTADGKRALAAKFGANRVALLTVDGNKVTYDKRDLPTGINTYNIVTTPDGKLAITADTGGGGSSDGNVDTVSVIDMQADPVRVIDHITVGDSPEGLAISPKGDLVVTVEARGSNQPSTSWYAHPAGAVTALRVNGKTVTRVGEVNVGRLPEGAVFSPDGSYLYVGNFIDQDLSVLKVDGDKLTDTGQRFKLPGHPASMRAGPQ
ncbi:MAG: beta-propeller fold lactonase family protein [Alphaproteobacteria bacterium]|nr:beta-propeller fold lactonase family protein [Alphaproteobacteria bacterium]MBV9863451.1 beta-propeller fold lactonase family protein [Alphaproteobacteria bacterium]